MICGRSQFRHLLFLMLATGPLQAHTVLLCDMMEVPAQETCCCSQEVETAREPEQNQTCNHPPCPVTPRAERDGCCDSSVQLRYQPEAGPVASQPPPDRWDPKPPAPIFIAYDLPVPPQPPDWAPVPAPAAVVVPDRSDLYLRTERLRI